LKSRRDELLFEKVNAEKERLNKDLPDFGDEDKIIYDYLSKHKTKVKKKLDEPEEKSQERQITNARIIHQAISSQQFKAVNIDSFKPIVALTPKETTQKPVKSGERNTNAFMHSSMPA
jgi:hypothetical protein